MGPHHSNPAPKRSKRSKHSKPNSASAPLLPADTVAAPVLDMQMFPHFLDIVFQTADYGSLIALRGVTRALRARVDERLSSHMLVRAPAAKGTPGVYIYTLFPSSSGKEEPFPLPAFAFYPYASNRPFNRARAAQEAEWIKEQGTREEYGDDHWAWNYDENDWERGWGPWTEAAASQPGLANLFGESGFASRRSSTVDGVTHKWQPAESVPRLQFSRTMTAGEVASAHEAAVRISAHVRVLDVLGPVGREADRLFECLRRVRSVRIFALRRAMVKRIPIPAPQVAVVLTMTPTSAVTAYSGTTIPNFVEGVPCLIEGVRVLTISLDPGQDGGCGPYGIIEPFAHPRTLREIVVLVRPRVIAEDDMQGPFETNHPDFALLQTLIDQGMSRFDRVMHTIVGLDATTASGSFVATALRRARQAGLGVSRTEEKTEAVKREFLRNLEERLRHKAATAQVAWDEERVLVLLAGVRFLTRAGYVADQVARNVRSA